MVPHLTSHSDSCDVGGDPEHRKTVRMLSQHHLSPSFLPSSEHLFHSGICQVSMTNAYLVSRVSSPSRYQLSCSRKGSGLNQKEVDMKKSKGKIHGRQEDLADTQRGQRRTGGLLEKYKGKHLLVRGFHGQPGGELMPIIALLLWSVPPT